MFSFFTSCGFFFPLHVLCMLYFLLRCCSSWSEFCLALWFSPDVSSCCSSRYLMFSATVASRGSSSPVNKTLLPVCIVCLCSWHICIWDSHIFLFGFVFFLAHVVFDCFQGFKVGGGEAVLAKDQSGTSREGIFHSSIWNIGCCIMFYNNFMIQYHCSFGTELCVIANSLWPLTWYSVAWSANVFAWSDFYSAQ